MQKVRIGVKCGERKGSSRKQFALGIWSTEPKGTGSSPVSCNLSMVYATRHRFYLNRRLASHRTDNRTKFALGVSYLKVHIPSSTVGPDSLGRASHRFVRMSIDLERADFRLRRGRPHSAEEFHRESSTSESQRTSHFEHML